ncbi:MAG: glucan biosynthesis protein [Acidiferrobacterales bacterium]
MNAVRRPFVATMLAAAALAGCALPAAVRNSDVRSQQALMQSSQALSAARTEAARRRKAMSALQTEVADLVARQADLTEALKGVRHVSGQTASPAAWGQTRARTEGMFKTVLAEAKSLAARHYKAPAPILAVLKSLSYVDYGRITFPGRLPGWTQGTPFHVSLYPAGYLFNWPVHIRVVAGSKIIPARLPVVVSGDPQLARRLPARLPTAGFSVYSHAAGTPLVNEFLSFLGASYFRGVGLGEAWGSSARGIAVDTALPHRAEEFPYFRTFWIIAPGRNAKHLGFCALLDSPTLTGAYRFIVRPGKSTVVDVKVVLFPRRKVRRLGIAPLTSMYLQGRFSNHRYDRLIRSAHDSDGLLIDTGEGPKEWRPLRNPRRLSVSRFSLTDPRGFGLMQRPRRAQDYRALGMDYENRPSVWVTPRGKWGSGHLLLVELPTDSQTNDNISVFWVPDRHGNSGQPLAVNYRIIWTGKAPQGTKYGYVSATRYSYNARFHSETYIVDFRGKQLANLLPSVVQPRVRVEGPARITHAWVTGNRTTGRWRLQFDVERTGPGPVRLRAALSDGKNPLTETWTNVFPLR